MKHLFLFEELSDHEYDILTWRNNAIQNKEKKSKFKDYMNRSLNTPSTSDRSRLEHKVRELAGDKSNFTNVSDSDLYTIIEILSKNTQPVK